MSSCLIPLIYLVPYVAILSRPLFILVLPPIQFHHFQKFSKLLHPLSLHLTCIQGFTIRLQPIQMVMLLNMVLRRIPPIRFNKANHLIIPRLPTFILFHIPRYSFVAPHCLHSKERIHCLYLGSHSFIISHKHITYLCKIGMRSIV